MRGRRKIISSRTKTGWLVNPCRHLSQHANSRLEWLAGTIAQGLLVRPTYSSGHGIMYHGSMHEREGEKVVWSHPTTVARPWIHVCYTPPRMNIGAQYVAKRIVTSYLGYFRCSLKKTCMYTGSGVLLVSNLASSKGSNIGLVKREKWHENMYTWLGTIFRCLCIISGHASLQPFQPVLSLIFICSLFTTTPYCVYANLF